MNVAVLLICLIVCYMAQKWTGDKHCDACKKGRIERR